MPRAAALNGGSSSWRLSTMRIAYAAGGDPRRPAIDVYVADAFTDEPFRGNPAAGSPSWPDPVHEWLVA
jgi:hypothetical protein